MGVYSSTKNSNYTSSKLETVSYLTTSVQQYVTAAAMINYTMNHSNQKQQKLIFNSVIHRSIVKSVS